MKITPMVSLFLWGFFSICVKFITQKANKTCMLRRFTARRILCQSHIHLTSLYPKHMCCKNQLKLYNSSLNKYPCFFISITQVLKSLLCMSSPAQTAFYNNMFSSIEIIYLIAFLRHYLLFRIIN